MICKKCGDKMYIIQVSDDEYEEECNNCGYLINWLILWLNSHEMIKDSMRIS